MDCPGCGKSLSTEQGMRQHHTKVHGESLPNRTCKGCERAFYDPKARRKFCDDCNPNGGEHNGNWKDAEESATCELCDATFEYYPSDKEGVYCSDCVSESDDFLGDPYVKDAEWIEKECEQCGTGMEVLQSRLDRGGGRFCTHRCLADWMSAQYGDGTATYNGQWRPARRKALERDEHTCRYCEKTREDIGHEPDVHHITPVRDFDDPQNAHTLDNLICLCKSCHVHAEVGNISTTYLRSIASRNA